MIKGIDYPEWYSQESLDTVLRGYVFENETPKQMYQRLAKTLSLRYADMLSKTSTTVTNQWDPLQMESVWFDYMWKGWLSPASPLLSNLGTTRGFPISCFGLRIADNTYDIFTKVREMSILTKYGGGK